MKGVPILFVGSILVAGLFGWLVASVYVEPIALWLRRRFRLDAQHIGAAEPLVD